MVNHQPYALFLPALARNLPVPPPARPPVRNTHTQPPSTKILSGWLTRGTIASASSITRELSFGPWVVQAASLGSSVLRGALLSLAAEGERACTSPNGTGSAFKY